MPADARAAATGRGTRLALTGIVVVGIGAAVTAAAWSDQNRFAAGARSSGFDIQARTSATGVWKDVGLPGNPDTDVPGNEIRIPPIAGALPGTSYAVPIYLCNAGDVDGVLSAAEISNTGTLVDLASVNVDTISIGTVLPANSCNDTDQVTGFIQLTTRADWVSGSEGTTDVIRLRIVCQSV
jgi:hypothetical protein